MSPAPSQLIQVRVIGAIGTLGANLVFGSTLHRSIRVKNAPSRLAAMFNLTEEGELRHAVESSGL
jgi:hypothetical protein